MRLLGKGILVEKIKGEKKTEGGIIIPEQQHKDNDCVVLMVGPKVENVKVGDKIRRVQFAGTPFDYEGKDCLYLTEDEGIDFIY